MTDPAVQCHTSQAPCSVALSGVYLPLDGEPVNVAVKLLKETANVELQEDFIREVEIMASCQHRNIVSLLGVLVQGEY